MADWLNIPEIDASPALAAVVAKLVAKRKIAAINLPALARRDAPMMACWTAPKGETFVSCDFSSLEPSITAHFSQDYYYKYATYDGIGIVPSVDARNVLLIDDVYLMLASVMPGLSEPLLAQFGLIQEKWLIDSEGVKGYKTIKPLRSKAKPASLGFNYGMGPRKFVKQSYEAGMIITEAEAKDMYNAYWDLFKDVRRLTKRLEAKMQKDGYLVNPFGYRLTCEPRKAYNAYIQSSASGVVDLLSLYFFRSFPYAKFVAFIHDEIIFTVSNEKLAECRQALDTAVLELNATLSWTVPMRLGFVAAKTFAEIK